MKLAVKITPNAKKSEIIGWEEDPKMGSILKIRIAAPPVEGKANKAVIAFFSDFLKVPKSQVSIIHGDTGRIKLIDLPDEAKKVLRKCQD